MSGSRRIVLGTRGSELARTQTAMVEKALRSHFPDLQIAIETITTRADENSRHAAEAVVDRKAGRKGMFTREIERALLEGEIDVAVHSAKDLPSDATPRLEVCAALPRAAVEDVLIAQSAGTLWNLPRGATVATGSIRRRRQLQWTRRDLNVVDLRGNVPTRLRKLTENAWDGIVLARAGLDRLGYNPAAGELEFIGQSFRTSLLPRDEFLSAGGQGVIALQARTDDAGVLEVLAQVNDAPTFLCLRAERDFLRRLQGDCDSPVGVLATVEENQLILQAQVFSDEPAPKTGKVLMRADHRPEEAAAALFEWMYGQEK